jgi:hypothetical protein
LEKGKVDGIAVVFRVVGVPELGGGETIVCVEKDTGMPKRKRGGMRVMPRVCRERTEGTAAMGAHDRIEI